MQILKLSTVVTIRIGPCLDSAGAEYTGLVIGDLTLTKNGTSAAMAAAATLTHIANGHYSLVTIAGNSDTLGEWRVDCNKSTYQIPPVVKEVVPATVYDALVTNATTAAGGLGDIQRMAGTALTGRDIGASVLLSTGTGTGQLDFTSGVVKADAVKAGGVAWASGAITSSVLATDAITSTGLAASAVTEIWAAVADSAGVTTLLSRLSSARAGYLDNINNANLASVPAFPSNFAALGINASGHISRVTLVDTVTTLTNAPSDSSGVTTLLSRLSATRAGYLDNIPLILGYSGYANASVWVDTSFGTAGTVSGINGTVTLPVDSLTDALTIAAANKLSHMHILNGGNITLAASLVGYDLTCDGGASLALGGQSIKNSTFNGFTISGIGTAPGGGWVKNIFRNCTIGSVTILSSEFVDCNFTGTLTLDSGGDSLYLLTNCQSGAALPIIDMGSAIGATSIYINNWDGPLSITNVKAGDIIHISGYGQRAFDD